MRAFLASFFLAALPAEPVDYTVLLKSRAAQAEIAAGWFDRPEEIAARAYFLGRRDAFLEAEAVVRYERWKLTN
jgi:hypothetical protein